MRRLHLQNFRVNPFFRKGENRQRVLYLPAHEKLFPQTRRQKMKHWIGFAFLMTLVSIVTMGSSCRHLAAPTFPATNTFTPTNTVPFTATLTRTPTNTFTVTNTPTAGSPTATPTVTSSPTVTSTFTITFTPTVTSSPTVTNTPGGVCTPVLEATYTFATTNECWTAMGTLPTTVVQTNSVGGATPPGGGAIEIVLPFTSSSTQELIGMQFSPGVTITPGSTISLLYQCVSSTTLTGQYTQVYTQGSVDGGNYFDYSSLVTETAATSNSWVTVSTTFPGVTGEGVTQFIFQVPANGAPYITSPVTVYIASVSITAPPPWTPTATPTPIQTWDFENGTAQGWSIVGGSETGTVLSTPTPDAGDSSLYALNLYAPFTSSGFVAPTNTGNSESAGIVQDFLSDIAAIPVLKKLSHLPVVADPSHGTGRRDMVPAMAKAAVAAGTDAILVEIHPNADKAVSDAAQTLFLDQFEKLVAELRVIAQAVGRTL